MSILRNIDGGSGRAAPWQDPDGGVIRDAGLSRGSKLFSYCYLLIPEFKNCVNVEIDDERGCCMAQRSHSCCSGLVVGTNAAWRLQRTDADTNFRWAFAS